MIERTVNFGDRNSWTDYGLIFTSCTIGTPEPQLVLIDVPFRDGSLDLTDSFGPLRYKDRTIHMDFLIPWWTEENHFDIYSRCVSDLAGKRTNITFSADIDWYYDARINSISDMAVNDGYWGFSIDALAKPYKRKSYITEYRVTGSKEIICHNAMMHVSPTVIITSTNPTVLIFSDPVTGGTVFWTNSEGPGVYQADTIILREGKNVLFVNAADGEMIIQYREGRL